MTTRLPAPKETDDRNEIGASNDYSVGAVWASNYCCLTWCATMTSSRILGLSCPLSTAPGNAPISASARAAPLP